MGVERGQQQGGAHPAVRVQLPCGPLAIFVDCPGPDAELTADLLGVQMGVDEAKASPFPLRQPFQNRILLTHGRPAPPLM